MLYLFVLSERSIRSHSTEGTEADHLSTPHLYQQRTKSDGNPTQTSTSDEKNSTEVQVQPLLRDQMACTPLSGISPV